MDEQMMRDSLKRHLEMEMLGHVTIEAARESVQTSASELYVRTVNLSAAR